MGVDFNCLLERSTRQLRACHGEGRAPAIASCRSGNADGPPRSLFAGPPQHGFLRQQRLINASTMLREVSF
jgi:hypothetical protein